MATTQITRVFRTKPQVFTPFLRKKTPFGNGFTMAHSVKKKGVSPENGVNVRL